MFADVARHDDDEALGQLNRENARTVTHVVDGYAELTVHVVDASRDVNQHRLRWPFVLLEEVCDEVGPSGEGVHHGDSGRPPLKFLVVDCDNGASVAGQEWEFGLLDQDFEHGAWSIILNAMSQAEWFSSPVAFCSDVFPPDEQPTEAQAQVLMALAANPKVAAKTHRSWGGSRLTGYASWWWYVTRPQPVIVTWRPVWALLSEDFEIRWLFACSDFLRQGYTERMPSIITDLRALVVSPSMSVLAITDQPREAPPAFSDAISVASSESRLLGVGIPGRPVGWFWDAFQTSGDFSRLSFSGRDSTDPGVRAHVEKMALELGDDDPWFRQQWLAEFA